jgi:hypothetical protein
LFRYAKRPKKVFYSLGGVVFVRLNRKKCFPDPEGFKEIDWTIIEFGIKKTAGILSLLFVIIFYFYSIQKCAPADRRVGDRGSRGEPYVFSRA